MVRNRLNQLLGLSIFLSIAVSPAFAQKPLELSGSYWFTHDPSMAKDGNTWYVFATGKAPHGGQIPVRCSEDLKTWRYCATVFTVIPDWIHKDSPQTQDLWAPDISYYQGEYRLYYAYSLFGKNTSGIGLAVNETLDPKSVNYHWVDKGLVLRSIASDDYNAIDPKFAVDNEGKSWLLFGSFWGGIKMRRLGEDGLCSKTDTKLYSLASREKPANPKPAEPGLPPSWQAVEAPFVVRHGDSYFLFVSWDLCCKGAKSTYRTMVGRSHSITGPYFDQNGKSMAEGGGTQLMAGNSVWAGPGGASAWTGSSGDLLVFHAYDVATGLPALQISPIEWKGGWPDVALETQHAPAPPRPEKKQ